VVGVGPNPSFLSLGCEVRLGWPSLLGLWGSGYDFQAGAALGSLTQAKITIIIRSRVGVVE